MEALLGTDHLSLKTACLGKNIALSDEETSATAQIRTGLLCGVIKTQEKDVSFHEYHKMFFTFFFGEAKKQLPSAFN